MMMIRVPRTRGDEPYALDPAAFPAAVFPARAGMNRTRSTTCATCARVFPARAGMNRHLAEPGHGGGGVPRTRVDEPTAGLFRLRPAECSPHARG